MLLTRATLEALRCIPLFGETFFLTCPKIVRFPLLLFCNIVRRVSLGHGVVRRSSALSIFLNLFFFVEACFIAS